MALTPGQVAAINSEVAAATSKLDNFIENEAGFFASSVEQDVASAKGAALIEGIIQSALLTGYALGVKDAAKKAQTS